MPWCACPSAGRWKWCVGLWFFTKHSNRGLLLSFSFFSFLSFAHSLFSSLLFHAPCLSPVLPISLSLYPSVCLSFFPSLPLSLAEWRGIPLESLRPHGQHVSGGLPHPLTLMLLLSSIIVVAGCSSFAAPSLVQLKTHRRNHSDRWDALFQRLRQRYRDRGAQLEKEAFYGDENGNRLCDFAVYLFCCAPLS